MFQTVGAPENSFPEQSILICIIFLRTLNMFFRYIPISFTSDNICKNTTGEVSLQISFINDFFLHLSRSQTCPNCDTKFPTCIVTGRPLMDYQFWMCGTCKHRAYEQEINKINHCPLCHAPVWSPITTLCIDVISSSLTARRVEQGLNASVLLTFSFKTASLLDFKIFHFSLLCHFI